MRQEWGNKRRAFILQKLNAKKPKADKITTRGKVATKNWTKYKPNSKVQIKGKVQIKKKCKMQNSNPKTHTMGNKEQAHEREHGRRQRLTNTMTGQRVKGTQRLNTQTLMTRQGTGEVDQQVR